MRKTNKILISLTVVLIAGLNIFVPAFAQDPFTAIAIGGYGGASGAGLFGSMAGMSGINIDYTSDPVNDAMWNKLNSESVYFSGEKHEATGIDEDIWDYITVDIGDWLDAQSNFIVNFAQTYGVTDNSSGTVTGYRRYADYELSKGNYGNPIGIATEGGIYSVGNMLFSIDSKYGTNPGYYNYTFVNNAGQSTSSWTNFGSDFIGSNIVLHTNNGVQLWLAKERNGSITDYFLVGQNILLPATNTNWTSEVVNTSIFDDWEAARVKIPHSISQLQTNWTIPDFLSELDRIWSGAGEDNILIEDTAEPPVPPVPPTPIPDTPLGDVPFDDWVDLWGQGIYEQLENQSDALDFIGSNGEDTVEELESIDSNLEDLNQTAESIDTNIGTGIGLLGGIKSGIESAVDFLDGIAENVGELVEEIVEGTETLIAGILNQIPTVFGVIFGPIKQASSIWHYVVEWIQSISAPMSWMWSMASGTSYNIVLPVYASLAGAVVLAFYKRFGK